MAKVKFWGMKLKFSIVRDLYKLPDEKLQTLMFQIEIKDSDKKKEEYWLVAYPLDNTGTIIGSPGRINLDINDAVEHLVPKGKLSFANLPFSRKAIAKFIKADETTTIVDLFLNPYKYPVGDAEYVAYKIFTHADMASSLIDGDLKPSPPAPPDDTDKLSK